MRKKPSGRIGRPRANRSRPDGDVREQILAAAQRLFRSRGYKATTTRDIAADAGLRQPSLFHYFGGKEAIFEAVAFGALQPVLDFIASERKARNQTPQSGSVQLYRLIAFDALHLLTNDNVIGPPALFSDASPDTLAEVDRRRGRIARAYAEALRAGVADGSLEVADARSTAKLLLGFVESVLNWPAPSSKPTKDAAQMADLLVRSVLADPDSISQVRSQASDG